MTNVALSSNQCDVCGAPATQWVGDPWGKSNVTRPKCAEHGVRLRDPAGIAEIERLRAALADVAKRLKTGYEPGCDCGGCRTMRYAEKALIGVAVETFAVRPIDCKHERAKVQCPDCGIDFLGGIRTAPRDVPIWICSVCGGWNHVQNRFCTHTHAVTAEKASGATTCNHPPEARGLTGCGICGATL